MAKLLSEQLAELSVRARDAENTIAAAQKEAHDKLAARQEQARAAVKAATEKVSDEIKSATDSAGKDWTAIKAKIAADINSLKASIAMAKHEHDVKGAEHHAERLEWEAAFAINYAVAAIEQAKLAVLNAVEGRMGAEKAKRTYSV